VQITADRALWILDYYSRNQTTLAFGGRILGEDGACEALISYVWLESHLMGLKLLSNDRAQSWERLIPLRHARFFLLQMGAVELEWFANLPCHSV
jgi:hypothetical protein